MLVLTILKIIGIILLVILGLLLAAALTVLFVPFRYRIWLEYRESLKAKVSVSWLLRLLEVKAVYDEGLDVDVRVLWFHPLRGDGDEAAEMEDETPEKTQQESKQPKENSEQSQKQSEQLMKQAEKQAEKQSEKSSARESTINQNGDDSQTAKTNSTSATKSRWKRISDFEKRLKNRIRRKWDGIRGKITSVRDFVTNERNQRVFFMILGQSKRLLHHILPKKVLLQADIGFDDPATTGNVLAAVSILYAFYGDRIQVTPYFDQEILQGEFEASGRICSGVLLYLAAKVWFHKDFRMLRKEYKDGGI